MSIIDSAGNDRLTFADSTNNVTVNLALTTARIVNANLTLTLSSAVSIENVFGGSGNDTLIGNTLANTYVGGVGTDSLNGGDGNDSLIIDGWIPASSEEPETAIASHWAGPHPGAVSLNLNSGQIEYVWAISSTYDNIFNAAGDTGSRSMVVPGMIRSRAAKATTSCMAAGAMTRSAVTVGMTGCMGTSERTPWMAAPITTF
ncbi:MAG: M10 family metallopeptidase C-terminal domain-containing protein [Planctomycetaceae bacterium]